MRIRSPSVTVIVPTYDRAGLLGQALDSVVRQRFEDFEVIVVDDGSTDATRAVVAACDDPRLRYVHQPHRGISAALNAGMRCARGALIARLDSDDLWLPDTLAVLVAALRARPDVGVAYGRGQAMDAGGRRLAHLQGAPGHFPDDSLRSLVFDDCTCNVALIARRQCFARAGDYDEQLVANEDWDMWLRIARDYRFLFIDQVLALIRWHDGNLTGPTSAQFARVLATRTAPLDKLFADPQLPAHIRDLRAAAYTNVHLFRGFRWWQARRRRAAARELARAVRVSGEPGQTLLRIVWRGALVPVLRESAGGRRAIAAVARWRARGAGGATVGPGLAAQSDVTNAGR